MVVWGGGLKDIWVIFVYALNKAIAHLSQPGDIIISMFPEYLNVELGRLCLERPVGWDKLGLLRRLGQDKRTAGFVPPVVDLKQAKEIFWNGGGVMVRGYLTYGGQHLMGHQIDPLLVNATPSFPLSTPNIEPGQAFNQHLPDYSRTLWSYCKMFGFNPEMITSHWFLQEQVLPVEVYGEALQTWRQPTTTVTAFSDGRLLVDTQTFVWQGSLDNRNQHFTRQSTVILDKGKIERTSPWTHTHPSGWDHNYGDNLIYLKMVVNVFNLATKAIGRVDQPMVLELVGGRWSGVSEFELALVQARPLPTYIDHMVKLNNPPDEFWRNPASPVYITTRKLPTFDMQKCRDLLLEVGTDGALRSMVDLTGVGGIRIMDGKRMLSHDFLGLLISANHMVIPVFLGSC
jgi:hypothetical protein